MTELIIGLAILGSVAAGLWDLKTTEVPDEIPSLMIASGIFYWFAVSATTGDSYPLFVSVVSSAVIGAAGWVLYKAGKWGGADGFMFAAVAAMIPIYNGRLFILDYGMNFIVVSAVYMFVYTAILGMMHRHIFGRLLKDLAKNVLYILAVPLAYFGAIYFLGLANQLTVLYGFLMIGLLVFWRYAMIIESVVFRRKISATQLKPGDVLEDMIWRGLTKKEVAHIKKTKKYVVIKEGVRFVPAFAITLVLTLLYGNLFSFISF